MDCTARIMGVQPIDALGLNAQIGRYRFRLPIDDDLKVRVDVLIGLFAALALYRGTIHTIGGL